MTEFKKKDIPVTAVSFLLLLVWGCLLKNTDSYLSPYLLVLAAAAAGLLSKDERKISTRERVLLIAGGLLFSAMTTLANYRLWLNTDCPYYSGTLFRCAYKGILFLLLAAGGFTAGYHVLKLAARYAQRMETAGTEEKKTFSPCAAFWIPFFLIVLVNCVIFFGCKYPGILTPDSLSQISQNLTGVYSNHHPFWHTMVIRACMNAGMALFHDINAAVAVYQAVQIVFMAYCFACSVGTMAAAGVSALWLILTTAAYVCLPYHILYSFTMWKDIPFAGCVLLLCVFLFRYLNGRLYPHKVRNGVMIFLSGVGMCLFRSNGFAAFLLVFLGALILFRKRVRFCLILTAVLVCSWGLKHPVLSALQVSNPDMLEMLSVPLQQTARVIRDYDDLTEEESALISSAADPEKLAEAYDPVISDPVKKLIRDSGGVSSVVQNKKEFLTLWAKLGLRHPAAYVKAWIDLTRGYWNGGYDYWKWHDWIEGNDLGIERTVRSAGMETAVREYLWLFTENPFLRLFTSIGLHVWLLLLLLWMTILRKDARGFLLLLPLLGVWASLLVSAPVYAEFRYVYAVFFTLPFLGFAVLMRTPSGKSE